MSETEKNDTALRPNLFDDPPSGKRGLEESERNIERSDEIELVYIPEPDPVWNIIQSNSEKRVSRSL